MSDAVRLALAGVTGLALGIALVPLVIRLAVRVEMLDEPGGWKRHVARTPLLGGVAIFVGVAASSAVWAEAPGQLVPTALVALGLMFVGLVDDRHGTAPLVRIGAVAAAALVLQASGAGWAVASNDVVDVALTVLWCLAVVNAINLLDLMDGAAASVVGVCALGESILAASLGDLGVAVVAASVVGACSAFLCFNLRIPARIFLGDGGTMMLGILVAAAPMAMPLGEQIGFAALPIAVLLLGIPLFDMTLRIAARITSGVPVMTPGPDSIANWLRTHVSSARRAAAALAGGQAALTALAILAADRAPTALLVSSILFVVGALLIFLLLHKSGHWTYET